MLNVVIPMAGAGSRFAKVGYSNPKPFIDVLGKPMIMHVVDNISIPGAKYIFVCQKKHMEEFGAQFIEHINNRSYIKDFEIITVEELTEGAACTLLLAKEIINTNDELLVVNSDQLVGQNEIRDSVLYFEKKKLDGGMLCFFNQSVKWSYCKINSDRKIMRLVEKQPISDHATVGIYWWRRGSDYIASAERMIEKNDRVNGEFYVAPTYNYLIAENKKLEPYFINEMHGLGTPEDLMQFLGGSK